MNMLITISNILKSTIKTLYPIELLCIVIILLMFPRSDSKQETFERKKLFWELAVVMTLQLIINNYL